MDALGAFERLTAQHDALIGALPAGNDAEAWRIQRFSGMAMLRDYR